ncbi:MAG: hypothetical protein ACRD13_01035, partial [Terriglobales bacterium]
HLIARLCFRGIYFPQKGSRAWLKVMLENRRVIGRLILESLTQWRGSAATGVRLNFDTGASVPAVGTAAESAAARVAP